MLRPGFISRHGGAAASAYETAVLADTPLLYWRLGESLGASVAADASGNGRTGSIDGATMGQTGALAGDGNTAALLDGVDDKVTSTYNPFSGSRTFEGWAKRVGGTTPDYIFGSDGANAAVFGLGTSSADHVYWYPNVASGEAAWTSVWPGTGNWVYWVLTYNDTTGLSELFLNDVSQGTRTPVGRYGASPGNFKVGSYAANSGPWEGYQDEVAVYSGILSGARITAHHDAGT